MSDHLTADGLRKLADQGEATNLPTRFSFIHLRELADRIEKLERAIAVSRIGMQALGSTLVQADTIFENTYKALSD